MNYEKEYKEAIKRAKAVLEIAANKEEAEGYVSTIFPELKESEDEKIRKELLEHCINRRDGKQVCIDASDYRRWADWLFRQGVENIPNLKSDKEISNEIIKFLELPHPQFVGKRHQEEWIAWLEKQGEHKLPIEKLPEEMKTIGESLEFTTQEECDEYNQMVSGLIMSDDNKEEQKQNVDNKKLTDVNHEYFSELLENDDSKDINDYAYQVAYCMSHDWLEETATWEDVQKAVKLGAEWQKQKLTWSEEDEEIRKWIINEIKIKHHNLDEDNVDFVDKAIAWLEKQGEQSSLNINRECLKGIKRVQEYQDLSDWEKEFDKIASMYAHNKNQEGYNDSWYVKERAAEMLYYAKKELEKQGGQKPDWGEEDENRINRLIAYFEDKEGFTAEDDIAYANWLKSIKQIYAWKPSDEHYELEEFAKIVRCNLTGISKAVQKLFEAKYLQLTGNKMYGGFKD